MTVPIISPNKYKQYFSQQMLICSKCASKRCDSFIDKCENVLHWCVIANEVLGIGLRIP